MEKFQEEDLLVLGFIGGHRIDTYQSCEELTGDTIDSVDKGKSLEKYVTRTFLTSWKKTVCCHILLDKVKETLLVGTVGHGGPNHTCV